MSLDGRRAAGRVARTAAELRSFRRENLQSLLDLSAKVSQLSDDKASEASSQLGQDRR